MVVPPLDALSIAAAVVQFVDFSCRIISKGNEYHKSVDGAIVENKELEVVAANIQDLSGRLHYSLSSKAKRALRKHLDGSTGQKQDQPLSYEEQALQAVVVDCQGFASELLEALERLKLRGNSTRWKSFRQAFKTIWAKEKIEAMLTKLGQARQQLVVNLLVVLSTHSESEFTQIKESNARLEATILTTIKDSGASIQKEIAKLSLVPSYNSVQQKENFKSTWSSRNEDDVSRMALALTEVTRQDRSNAINTMLLDSLYFTQIAERRSNIREAHHSTFKWVFQPTAELEDRWTNLPRWLDGTDPGQNVYWITGKAGSGKSTLMRYLYEAKETKNLLNVWAGSSRLLTACCFFWNPGNDIQKSLNGLLRTLLHELLTTCPQCIKIVAPWRWRSLDLGAKFLEPWTDAELLNVLDAFFRNTAKNTHICLFVDGLDEFHGTDETRENLIDLLQKLASKDNAKICLSSRPWNIFEDAFGRGPMLRLEDLTRPDIQRYVSEKLTQHRRFEVLKQLYEEECIALVDNIVDKASGVFLWVYLVVRSLTQGLRDEDGISDLTRRLELIPADLELYFDQMLSTIDPFHLPRSSELFQLTMCTDRRLSQLTLSFIHEDKPDALVNLLRRDREAAISHAYSSTSRRVNALSKGLLEVNRTESTNPYFRYGVDFLHRTVRDFLAMDEVRQKLEKYSKGAFPCHLHLCTAVLAQIRSLGPNYESLTDAEAFLRLLDEFLFYASALESRGCRVPENLFTTLKGQLDLFDTSNVVDKACLRSREVQALDLRNNLKMFTSAHWSDGVAEDKNNQLSFFISSGLFYPVERLIESDPSAISDKKGRPLLDYALRRDRNAAVELKVPNLQTTRFLLGSGADPNQMYNERTVWHVFLSWMRDNKRCIDPSPEAWVAATKLMIEHGADAFPTVGAFFREIFDTQTAKDLNTMLSERDTEAEPEAEPGIDKEHKHDVTVEEPQSEKNKKEPDLGVKTDQGILSGFRQMFLWSRWG
ncbi:uncharacterized protein PV06_00157 [Exophiala oligosperma]|uniref:Uncharacterized protein n=2 Tax=Chaetothyriales TaxID=34395 RepID=A0A0D2CBZ4_9EURO|nr:uncharacterized protein PV06_00157 [Exophiala oligosperma]KAJ9647444.1 hypothetical protein H2204_000073 [Knufia peltigerae]KIW47462.1 hypothetical protein PV06_00157 [Exophiala oligosperma]